MDTAIEMRGLMKRFRSKTAADNLTLAVPTGSIFALLGDNGAGKTTTIRMLTGLLRPDSGQATILRHDCWSEAFSLRHLVGYVPERPKFYDWMTVSEIGWFSAGFHKPGYLPRYQQMTDHFRLPPRAKLRNLSKGEYAKVALSLALAMDPEVLILDEPTSGLDLLVRREFLSSMVDLAGTGRTILISSHQIAEIERIASHVAFIANGQLLLTASTEELRKQIIRLRLRYENQPPDATELGTVLQRNGTGKQWEAIVQNPNRDVVERIRTAGTFFDFEETPLCLEDAYCALLARREDVR
jgi:ABC-2 type transport system ATP-binding protein